MEIKALLLSIVFILVLIALVPDAGFAQRESPHPLMYQNLYDSSKILKNISFQLSTGKATPEAQKAAGDIIKRISQILLQLSGLGIHYNHQAEIEKMKKHWDPWTKMQEEQN